MHDQQRACDCILHKTYYMYMCSMYWHVCSIGDICAHILYIVLQLTVIQLCYSIHPRGMCDPDRILSCVILSLN